MKNCKKHTKCVTKLAKKKKKEKYLIRNEKYLKSKIKSYDSKINIIFHDSCVPKEGSHCICLSVILIDWVFEDR